MRVLRRFWERCVSKTLAFAFGLRLRSKTRCFKTRVLWRRLPNGKPQERLRFRALRGKNASVQKRIAIIFCDLKTSLGARACVQVTCVQKTRRFVLAFLNLLRFWGRVLRRVLRRGSDMGFTVNKGSQKGF